MNAITERWVRTCRTELLDRTLIWNKARLLHALREYEQPYNQHRPHRTLASAAPRHSVLYPNRSANPTGSPRGPSTRPPRRHPARVPTCGAPGPDVVLGTYKVDFENANAVSSPAGGFDVVTMRLVYTFMSDKRLWPGGCPACCGPAARGHVGTWARATERRQQ
ncbi:integrase core domain-containing protein [Streptomyces sp. NBC_01003]|uniref:integrase core domain-containing protein n=1 Tax=Streptomyces sp. NBC_01003 TaxID=2903714 RepID=UPI003868D68E